MDMGLLSCAIVTAAITVTVTVLAFVCAFKRLILIRQLRSFSVAVKRAANVIHKRTRNYAATIGDTVS